MQAKANALLDLSATPAKQPNKGAKASSANTNEFLSYIKEQTPKETANTTQKRPETKNESAPKQPQKQEKEPTQNPNNDVKNDTEPASKSNDTQSTDEIKPKSPLEQKAAELKEASDKAIAKLEGAIGEEGAATMLDDANLMQLLAVLDAINAPKESLAVFPKLGEKLATLLAVPENAKALSEAKSVADVIDLAKKFDLIVKDIEITSELESALNEKFPNLASKEFFKAPELAAKPMEFLAQTKINESLKEQKNEKPTSLASLLEEVYSKDDKATNTELSAAVAQKQNIDEKSQKELSIKQDTQKSNITLKDLVFPEKAGEQPNAPLATELEPLSVGDEVKSEIGLNAAAKNIVAEAKMQLHNRTQVRETLSNFSSNLAEQVANYKAPITRMSMTLNPLNLGEVEVVMTTRGNNLHINFTSNTQAMNLFIANQAEFKNSLVNMGFTELSMNFSDQNQKGSNPREQAPKGRSFSIDDEENITQEQISLELILPRYI